MVDFSFLNQFSNEKTEYDEITTNLSETAFKAAKAWSKIINPLIDKLLTRKNELSKKIDNRFVVALLYFWYFWNVNFDKKIWK